MKVISPVGFFRKINIPAPLPSILINLRQDDVLAFETVRQLVLTEDGKIAYKPLGWISRGQGSRLSGRDHGKVAVAHTKHPLLYPLPDLLYPEFHLVAILARWPHARLQCGREKFLHVRFKQVRVKLRSRRRDLGSWGRRGTRGGHHETEEFSDVLRTKHVRSRSLKSQPGRKTLPVSRLSLPSFLAQRNVFSNLPGLISLRYHVHTFEPWGRRWFIPLGLRNNSWYPNESPLAPPAQDA